MRSYFMPLLFAACFAPAAASVVPPASDPPVPAEMTLREARTLASERNLDLRARNEEVAAMEARLRQAGLLPNPALELIREGSHARGGSSTIQLSVPVELGGKRTARIDTAGLELQAARLQRAALRSAISAELVALYHEAYLAQRSVEIATSIANAARSSTAAAARRVAAGKASPVEESRAKVAEANMRIELAKSQGRLTEALSKLSVLIGIPASGIGHLAPPGQELPALPSADEIRHRIPQAPEILRAIGELQLRQSHTRLERARTMPDISLIVGVKREGPARERQNIFGVSLPLPIFDRNQGGIAEAERRAGLAQTELEGARLRAHADATGAHARLAAALAEEALIRIEVLPGAQFAAEAAMKGFEAGKFNYLELLDAQRTHYQAQAQHLEAIASAHRASADLEKIIGPGTAATPSIQDSK